MIQIAWSIALQIADGQKMESVKQEAKDFYGVSMSTIDRAWADHKDSELIGPVWKAGRTIN
jgi:DNA-binding transcriptional regulator YhcF (GntR family)